MAKPAEKRFEGTLFDTRGRVVGSIVVRITGMRLPRGMMAGFERVMEIFKQEAAAAAMAHAARKERRSRRPDA